MQVPSGQVNPGLSFFRAMQNLTQRPQPPAHGAQAQTAARASDGAQAAHKARGDVQQANRPADPGQGAGRTGEPGAPRPRGSVIDVKV